MTTAEPTVDELKRYIVELEANIQREPETIRLAQARFKEPRSFVVGLDRHGETVQDAEVDADAMFRFSDLYVFYLDNELSAFFQVSDVRYVIRVEPKKA